MSELRTEAAGWPDGWYIYENGKVEGPFVAAEAFGRGSEASDGKPRLVSRKGFSQWYALKDLSEIFRMTEHLGKKAQNHQEITELQIARFKNEAADGMPAQPQHATPPPPVPRVKAKQIDAAPSAKPSVPTAGPAPVLAGAAADQPELVRVAVAKMAKEPPKTEKKAPSAKPSAKPAKPMKAAPPAGSSADSAAMQEYFLARNRLRLGKLRNPWMSAFVGAPLSLGVYWAVWTSQLAKEIHWHTKQTPAKSSLIGVLAMIPIVHFFATFRLAKQLRDMEMQNKYASVSPAVACLLAIIPPFALAYLQDAANRHWLLHVKYSLAKPKSGEA